MFWRKLPNVNVPISRIQAEIDAHLPLRKDVGPALMVLNRVSLQPSKSPGVLNSTASMTLFAPVIGKMSVQLVFDAVPVLRDGGIFLKNARILDFKLNVMDEADRDLSDACATDAAAGAAKFSFRSLAQGLLNVASGSQIGGDQARKLFEPYRAQVFDVIGKQISESAAPILGARSLGQVPRLLGMLFHRIRVEGDTLVLVPAYSTICYAGAGVATFAWAGFVAYHIHFLPVSPSGARSTLGQSALVVFLNSIL